MRNQIQCEIYSATDKKEACAQVQAHGVHEKMSVVVTKNKCRTHKVDETQKKDFLGKQEKN